MKPFNRFGRENGSRLEESTSTSGFDNCDRIEIRNFAECQ